MMREVNVATDMPQDGFAVARLNATHISGVQAGTSMNSAAAG